MDIQRSRHCRLPNLSAKPPQKKAPTIIPRYTMLPVVNKRRGKKRTKWNSRNTHLRQRNTQTEVVIFRRVCFCLHSCLRADLYEQNYLYAASWNRNSIKLSVDWCFHLRTLFVVFQVKCRGLSVMMLLAQGTVKTDYISSPKEKQIAIKNVSDFRDLRILYRSFLISLSNMLYYMLCFQHLQKY